MAGSGRFPPYRLPTPMPGWQACSPPADPEEDHRARPIVLENHSDAYFEGQRIVLIPECELRLLLPQMLSQRDDLQAQAAIIRMELEQARQMGGPAGALDAHWREGGQDIAGRQPHVPAIAGP